MMAAIRDDMTSYGIETTDINWSDMVSELQAMAAGNPVPSTRRITADKAGKII